MRKKALCLVFGTMLAGGAVSVVNADEPLTLTADQMDQVTAGRTVSGLQIDFVERLEGIFAELQSDDVGQPGGTGMDLPLELQNRLTDLRNNRLPELRDRLTLNNPGFQVGTSVVIGNPD